MTQEYIKKYAKRRGYKIISSGVNNYAYTVYFLERIEGHTPIHVAKKRFKSYNEIYQYLKPEYL